MKLRRVPKVMFATWAKDHGGYWNTFRTLEEAAAFEGGKNVPIFSLTAKHLGLFTEVVVMVKEGKRK